MTLNSSLPHRQPHCTGTLRVAALTLFCLVAVFVPTRDPIGAAQNLAAPTAECPPVAPTPSVSLAYGRALLDGTDAPIGTVVEAVNPRGDTVGCIEVTTAGHYGAMFIYGEDTSTPTPIPGMRDGETVAFKMEGEPALATPAFVWHADRDMHETALAGTLNPTASPCYTLITRVNPAGSGSVTTEPATACLEDPRPGQYAPGIQVEIQAIPDSGHVFSHWDGDVQGNASRIAFIMDQDLTFIARFEAIETVSIYLPLLAKEP